MTGGEQLEVARRMRRALTAYQSALDGCAVLLVMKDARLLYPLVALDAPMELQLVIHVGDVGGGPSSNLLESKDPVFMQYALEFGSDAFYRLEIIRRRRGGRAGYRWRRRRKGRIGALARRWLGASRLWDRWCD